MTFTIGWDLGQAADFAAITVIERRRDALWLRYSRRIPLGTEYPVQVQHIRRLYEVSELRGAQLAFDATGAYAMRDYVRRDLPGVSVVPVVLTGGENPSQGWQWNIPKSSLMNNLLVLAERGDFAVSANMRGADELRKEIRAFRLRLSKHGNELLEAGRGEHDDLVLSAAMATWVASRSQGTAFVEYLQQMYREQHDGREFVGEVAGDPNDPFPDKDPNEQWRTLQGGQQHVSTFDSLTGRAVSSAPVIDGRLGGSVPIRFDVRTGRPYRARPDSDDVQEPEDPGRRVA